MINRGIHDFVTLTSSPAASTRYSTTVKIQRRRLEGIVVFYQASAAQVLGTATGDSFANIVKRVRVKVNDVSGSRFCVDASGAALLEEWVYLGGKLPWPTISGFGNTSLTTGLTPEMVFPVWFRHPQLEDPAGNLTSIPLYELREDMNIEVELGAVTDVSATGFTFAGSLRLGLLYRDVEGGEYIPSEVITSDKASLATSSKVDLEIPSNGLLTSVLLQSYDASTGLIRTSPVSATGDPDVTLYYGREQIRRCSPQLAQYIAQLGTNASPLCTFNGITNTTLKQSIFFDLMDDLPITSAFSARSALNLTSIRAGGDLAKVSISQTGSTSPTIRMTTRKFLGGPVDKIMLA